MNTRKTLLAPAIVLAVSCLTPGCSSSDNTVLGPNCGGSEANNFVQPGSVEILVGKTYTFSNGAVFHPDLAGVGVDVGFDVFSDPVLSISLAATGSAASAEATLGGCSVGADPACLFDFTVIGSSFPIGTGPQTNDVLAHEDWRYHARLDNCTERVTSTLTVENTTGTTATSDVLDLPGTSFCPVICSDP